MRVVLGIESSCDETAAALVTDERVILAQRIASQDEAHRPYGGVVPEIAARAHAELLTPLIEETLADAGMKLADVDAIAATAGPGLIGGVMVGLVTAKALAMAGDKPLIAINHLEGHALSPRLADETLGFPYLLLLVSGGHCQLLLVEGAGRYRRLATTIDDALGEAFDKTAKILGLGYPGGPAVERLAAEGDARAVPLPRPLLGSAEPHFSFAGLKSAVLRAKQAQRLSFDKLRMSGERSEPGSARVRMSGERSEPGSARVKMSGERSERGSARVRMSGERSEPGSAPLEPSEPSSAQPEPVEGPAPTPAYTDADIAASFQQAAVDCLIDRTARAIEGAGPVTALVVAGGVAANKAIRAALEALAAGRGLRFVAPPLALCTDNAAMIAWAGVERLGQSDPLDFAARPRWPLDAAAEPVRGAGVKA